LLKYQRIFLYIRAAKLRDQVPANKPEGEQEGQDPKGLFQTIMRSAHDDFKIMGNVFKHLTGA
jgi:hypothetical protein